MNRGQQLSLIGGIGLVVGALLPWATVTSTFFGVAIPKAGYEGDGLITGAIGLLMFIVAITAKGKPGKTYSILLALLAIISAIILISDLLNVNKFVLETTEDVIISTGVGLYISIVGAVLGIVGGLQQVPTTTDLEANPQDKEALNSDTYKMSKRPMWLSHLYFLIVILIGLVGTYWLFLR